MPRNGRAVFLILMPTFPEIVGSLGGVSFMAWWFHLFIIFYKMGNANSTWTDPFYRT